jgi:hypothetical protein
LADAINVALDLFGGSALPRIVSVRRAKRLPTGWLCGTGTRFCPHAKRAHASLELYYLVQPQGAELRCNALACATYGRRGRVVERLSFDEDTARELTSVTMHT